MDSSEGVFAKSVRSRKLPAVMAVATTVFAFTLSLIGNCANGQTLFVTDISGGNVYKIAPDGSHTIFASGLGNPLGIAVDSLGDVFVSNTSSIFKITPDGTKSTFAAGMVSYGMTFRSDGTLFVAGVSSGSIYEYTPAGVQSTFATGLSLPFDVAFDSHGNLFEMDYNGGGSNSRVIKITSGGVKSTFATGLVDAQGIAVDANDNVYVSEPAGTIVKYTPSGSSSTFGTGGGFYGMGFDSSGNLAVTDGGNIDKFAPNGTKSVFATGISGAYKMAFSSSSSVPEPGAIALGAGVLSIGSLAFVRRRRRFLKSKS